MKVLIVDDNGNVRKLLRSMLDAKEREFFEASDGVEAIEQYGREAPDVVLMDLRMPRMNGIEATRNIRRGWPKACVLIVTDYDEPALRELARSAGAEKYFLKDSLEAVTEYVDRRRVKGEA